MIDNFAQHLFGINAVQGQPLALVDETQQLTYQQLEQHVKSFAQALKQHKLKPQSRVILYFDDCVEWPVAFLAAIWAGLNPVCVNHNNTKERLKQIVELVDAEAIITDQELDLEQQIIVIDKGQILSQPLAEDCSFYRFHPDEPCLWVLTSGTTGHPKAIVHRHHSLVNYHVNTKSYWNFKPGTRIFSPSKLSFAYGLTINMCMSLCSGATSYLMSGTPAPSRIFNLIKKHSIQYLFTVPTIINSMIKHSQDNVLHDSLQQVICGGEMLPPVISKQFREKFDVVVKNAYGMSELLSLCIAQSMDDYADGMLGQPLPGVECKVLDANGNQVAPGDVGELYVKSQYTASFYWKDWKYTNHTFVGDWLRTGDRVKLWPNQNFEYLSRADDQIKINGQFVSSVEVESKILEFPGITDCAVVFKTAENTLPEIHAFIVDENLSVSIDAIKNFLSNTMPAFKIPRYFHTVISIPKTLTNKKTRYVLKEKL